MNLAAKEKQIQINLAFQTENQNFSSSGMNIERGVCGRTCVFIGFHYFDLLCCLVTEC